jgi:arylsulfatase A-like enzyme
MNAMPSKIKLAVVVCALALLSHTTGCRNKPEARSNAKPAALKNAPDIEHVIIISIDTLRADHLGCYGHPFVQSPNIDAFAKESVLFTNHISAAPTTLASHTSLLTGTYPHTHGAPKNGFVLGDDNEMLAEVLAENGFDCAGIIGAFPLDPVFNFDQGFAHFDASFTVSFEKGVVDQHQRLASEVTDAATRWLDKRRPNKAANRDRLFMFVHYFDVHWPYEAPFKYRRLYGESGNRVDGSMDNIETARKMLLEGENDPTLLKKALEFGKALDNEYAAEITYCDEHVGRFLDDLKKRGIYDKSLIILTSDHGETMHEHRQYFSHGATVYDSEVHTPLIVRFPGQANAGQRESRIVSNVDVVPTILHLLNLPGTKRMEGASFAGLVDGPLPERPPVFSEATKPWWDERFHDKSGWVNQKKFQCARSEAFKYVARDPDQLYGFYELAADRDEQNNLIDSKDPQHTKRIADLKKRLAHWQKQADPIPAFEDTSPETLRKMYHLGYAGPADDPIDASTN